MSDTYLNNGPPDPIAFFRQASDANVGIVDSSLADIEDGGDSRKPCSGVTCPPSPRRNQEAPARERPPPGHDWPYRVSNTKTRFLSGSVESVMQDTQTFVPENKSLTLYYHCTSLNTLSDCRKICPFRGRLCFTVLEP